MDQFDYSIQSAKLLKSFDRACTWYRPNLTVSYGKAWTESSLSAARQNYERLIPQIPFIGGPKVHMTEDLMESVQVLALLQAMNTGGRTIEEMRIILHKGIATRLSQYPAFVRKLAAARAFSKPFIHNLILQAEKSEERRFPGGFVFQVVTGNGIDFDWGLNIYECGICKFYSAQGATGFMSMVCTIDFPLSEGLGYGLERTQTLADGAEYCNPRMKRGRETQPYE